MAAGKTNPVIEPASSNVAPVARIFPNHKYRLYLISIVSVITAIVTRMAFQPLLGDRAWFWTFHIAVVVSALFGGFGPGMFATLLSAASVVFFFLSPQFSFRLQDPSDGINLVIFVFVSVIVSSLSERMRRSRERAEKAAQDLIEKESTVRTMLARTTDAVIVLDDAWRFIHANERAVEMIGRSAQELIAATLWDVFPHSEGSELHERLTSAMQSRAADRFESYFAAMDLWAEAQVYPTQQGVTLFLTDTTAAHAAARQRAVLAAINEAVRAAGPNAEVEEPILTAIGRLLGVNRCMIGDVKSDGQTVVVKHDYCDSVETVAGSYRLTDSGPAVMDLLHAGKSVVVPDLVADTLFDADSKPMLAARSVAALVAVPIINDNRLIAIFSVHSIVRRSWPEEEVVLLEQCAARAWASIEAARSAASLRQSEERLRLALDAGELGVWDWDVLANKVTWSDRIYEFHGITREVFSGYMETELPLTHPDDRKLVRDAMDRALAGEAPYQIEFRAVRPSGEVRWLFTNGTVFRNADGHAIRVLGATIDITDRKRIDEQREELLAGERSARAEAERAGRMKDEFLATLSHELRTPLNAILGWSQLIRSGRLPEDELQHGLETIERNARVQTQLIDDLLDMSRIISGKVRLEVQRLNLADAVKAAVATVRPTADAKEISLRASIDDATGSVTGDPGRLQQIIWNLLSNAIKFTPRGGRVSVELHRSTDNTAAHVIVTDTGQGITAEFLPYVFDRFRQADASTTRRHGGLGLGLSIVKHLVEMHGGTVAAHSDGQGTGASFTITLPLASPLETPSSEFHPRAVGIHIGRNDSEPTLAGVKVLVVDDEPDARELVSRLLVDRGCHVHTAGSARDAVSSMDDLGPLDVIVSDIGLPGEDGYALIRNIRLREANRGGKVPAIALTAYARAEDRTRAILAGYQVHLTKPVEPSELLANVASLAGRTATASN